jgi:thiamine kinase-like enzyme
MKKTRRTRKRGGASTFTQELTQAKVILNKMKTLLESELSEEMNKTHKSQVAEVVDSYIDKLVETVGNITVEARDRDREYIELHNYVGSLIRQLGDTPVVGGRRR